MTGQAFLHRYFSAVYLLLIALMGCVAGWVAVIILGIWLASPVEQSNSGNLPDEPTVQMKRLSDFQIILDRNIFNLSGTGKTLLAEIDTDSVSALSSNEAKDEATIAVNKDFFLVGTIVAGLNSLAVVMEGKETNIYRLGDEIEDGILVEEIRRNTVVLLYRDGSRQTLTLSEDRESPKTVAAPPKKKTGAGKDYGVRQIGENKWVIPKEVAEETRNNVNELLKQARMEPRIVDGMTDGFVVRSLRANSFLDQIGLRRGDVLMAINSVPLNSPEKALQIFQQLREARDIKIDLLRKDQPLTLEFETN